MRSTVLLTLALGLLLSSSQGNTDSINCLGCHDFGPDSPVHSMLESLHGDAEDGCQSCHGPSEDHQQRPNMASPDVSFGPRWSASTADQDGQCLECHRENVASHWQESLHMANNLSCITCHDLHQDDKVLQAELQGEVCGVCHKAQKDGMHALSDQKKTSNPTCTTCHNPHADQSPITTMLVNHSKGCRSCHDLVAMASSDTVTDKAKSYHKIMSQQGRSCADCHQGVAHGSPDAVEPFVPLPVSSRLVTLFYPGQSDVDWILTEHPGSQPFRQGSNCQQCHRGEEVSMGASLGGAEPGNRSVAVRFGADNEILHVEINWSGDRDDAAIAMMWGDGGSNAFRRGGCWAACHSDMPGMSRDRGLNLGKYLSVSRQQAQRIGQPPLSKDPGELEQLLAAGDFVNMWRVDLEKGTLQTARVLNAPVWKDSDSRPDVHYSNGHWTVKLSRPLVASQMEKNFTPGTRYTFGIALHSKGRPGAGHWVSLPMSVSLDRNDTDFLVE